MTGGVAPPPARERNRHGIRAFSENPPSSAEALFDRVELRVSGSISVLHESALDRFAGRIGSGDLPRLFGRAQRYRGSWVARIVSGSTISAGEISISRAMPDPKFTLRLAVNPVRTLGHLLDRYRFDEIERVPLGEFFAPTEAPSALTRTLDGQDNMVSDFLAFAGSVHANYVQRVATYLRLFEANLRMRLLLELCPEEDGYEYRQDQGVYAAWNDHAVLRLDWGGLTVSQAEACWERHDPHALSKVHDIADGVLNAARSALVRTHPTTVGPSVERDLGALSVKVPLTPNGHIMLVVYAKALDRLRVEVRYQKNLPDLVRGQLPNGPRKLTDWFDAIAAEAAPRVPWEELHRLLSQPENASVEALADLLDLIAAVTTSNKAKRRSILRQLLLHGAVTATNRDGDAPASMLERLAERGVLEHTRLLSHDAPHGRRYRLAERYRGLAEQAWQHWAV